MNSLRFGLERYSGIIFHWKMNRFADLWCLTLQSDSHLNSLLRSFGSEFFVAKIQKASHSRRKRFE